eukprot:1890212-Prymnesium_polylepis.1
MTGAAASSVKTVRVKSKLGKIEADTVTNIDTCVANRKCGRWRRVACRERRSARRRTAGLETSER